MRKCGTDRTRSMCGHFEDAFEVFGSSSYADRSKPRPRQSQTFPRQPHLIRVHLDSQRRLSVHANRPRLPKVDPMYGDALDRYALRTDQPRAHRHLDSRERTRPVIPIRFRPDDFLSNPLPPTIDPPVQDIILRSFSVTPDRVGPFGAASLAWEVEAPPDVRVKINSELVAQSGVRIVQPISSSTYRLYGLRGTNKTLLGAVDLDVELSSCSTFQMLNPQTTLQGALRANIDAMEDVYSRSDPVVSFAPHRISFDLHLGADINNFPDPTIRIKGSWGLGVSDGRLTSWGHQVSADVSVPWWAWSIPGAVPGLAIALSGAKDEAEEQGENVIVGLTALLEFLWATQEGFRRHSVRVGADDDGSGVIELTECPYDALQQIVDFQARRFENSEDQTVE